MQVPIAQLLFVASVAVLMYQEVASAATPNTDMKYCFNEGAFDSYEANFGPPTFGAVEGVDEEDESVVDVVYTWVNGSDPFQLAQKHFWENHDHDVEKAKALDEQRVALCDVEMQRARKHASDYVRDLWRDQHSFINATVACALGVVRAWGATAPPSASSVFPRELDVIALVEMVVEALGGASTRHCGPAIADATQLNPTTLTSSTSTQLKRIRNASKYHYDQHLGPHDQYAS